MAWKKRLKLPCRRPDFVVGGRAFFGESRAEHAADVCAERRRRVSFAAATRPSHRALVGGQRFVEAGRLDQFQRRQTGGHRDRVAGQRAGLIDRAERGDLSMISRLPPKAPSGMPPPTPCRRWTDPA
jgi:hypothetical protein